MFKRHPLHRSTSGMDAAPASASAPALVAKPALTARAIALGLLAGIALAVLTPLNDWWLRNTPLYNNYNPCIATAAALLLGLCNPLLGRRRLRSGELAVVVACVLAVGGVVSGGLMRGFTASVAGGAKTVAEDPTLAPLAARQADGSRRWPLPRGFFLATAPDGTVDPADPEYRVLIDRYFTGNGADGRVDHRTVVAWRDDDGEHRALAWRPTPLAPTPAGALPIDGGDGGLAGLRPGQSSGAATVLAVAPQRVPWDAWLTPALAWSPLLVGALAALLALTGIVRRQWIEHERLPYPIAEVNLLFLAEPSPGRRLAPILRERGFRLGFLVTVLLLTWKGLGDLGWVPVPLQTTIAVWPMFQGEPWNSVYSWWWLFNWPIWFSVVALAFFLPLDLSFSLWAFWLGLNAFHLLLRRAGVPIESVHYAQAGVGGCAAWCVLILWLGRRWYLAALRAAFRRAADPAEREAGAYCRVLLLATALMVGTLIAAGAEWSGAVLVAALFLGAFLVLSRIFAEAGVPFFGLPGWGISQVVLGLTGAATPATALVPLGLIGMSLLADNREGLMPYAVHGGYLAERTGVRQWPLSTVLLIAVVAAMAVSGATMLWFSYGLDGHPLTAGRGNVGYELHLVADRVAAREPGQHPLATPWAAYAIGATMVSMIGIGRLLWAAFPLHPIGFLTVFNYASGRLAFSCFLGWAIKAGVMRYGGVGIYKRLKPVAVGVVAGEAAASLLFILVICIAKRLGLPIAAEPEFMPR